jgi:NitT/TauT family transport system permease protein
MDQLIWRPLLAWADKFKMEMVEAADRPRSAVLRILRRSLILEWMGRTVWVPLTEWSDHVFSHTLPRVRQHNVAVSIGGLLRWLVVAFIVVVIVTALHGALGLVSRLTAPQIELVVLATLTTLARVVAALLISVLWTVPVGVFIGLNRKWAARLTPVTQIAASVPATALFPGLVALLIHLRGGLNVASVVLMILGTQWYILFNVIAGASAIPEDLREATQMFRLNRIKTWSTLILPAIAPFLITGLITAAGGAWNASIVAEYVSFQGHVYTTFGVGSIIARASQNHGFSVLLLATGTLAVTVVLINRLVWRRLYNKAADRYSVS